MRALIATTGTEGDVRPFLALGRELLARGHEVLVAAPDRFARTAAEHAVSFRAIGPPWDAEELARTLSRVLASSNPLVQVAIIMESLAEPQRRMLPELLAMAPEHDVVVYHPMLVAAASAARARDVPHVSVQLTPLHRARSYGPMGGSVGPLLNGALWSLAARMLRRATDATLNTIVEAAGLAPWCDVLAEGTTSRLLDLVAVSPSVIPRDPAWPTSSHASGYLFLDEPSFVPDPTLAAFVGEERPVVIGWGSMHGFDADATTRAILEAVHDLPRKVVLQAGWAGLGQAPMPAHVHVARFVPHSWLFPRAACVVHHGGAGTTASVFRAGIPQTFVWHFGDQPTWARRARRQGVSAGSVRHDKLSGRWLRRGIDRMLTDQDMQIAARRLGEAIRKENGAASAAEKIERAVAGGQRLRGRGSG
jgi:UDP:flavonoid glycosyltransferase YjiC (YdhE family)